MVCNYCFESEELNDYIKDHGSQAASNYKCPECQSSNDVIYIISKNTLAMKLQKIISILYEHDNDLGMMHYAQTYICEDGEEANSYAELESLQSICWNLFEDEDKLSELLSSNINYAYIKDGGDDLFSDTYSEVWKDKCWWDDEYFGLSQWQKFCENVKHKARYFSHPSFSVQEALQNFSQLFEKLEHHESLEIYRARKINSLNEKVTIESNPLCELGKVPIRYAKNNRFSPVGISYGYFALDETTALQETRITKEQAAIGKFSTNDTLKLIDFRQSTMKGKVDIFKDDLDSGLYCQQKFILEFLKDVSKPISDNDQLLEYVPTQIMAEYIWHLGYDGFLFDSSQNDYGVNVVIFEAKYSFISFQIKEKD